MSRFEDIIIIIIVFLFLSFLPSFLPSFQKTRKQHQPLLEKKGENTTVPPPPSFHTPSSSSSQKRRRRRTMGNQRARSRGLRHGTRNMFTRGFRQNGPKNATTYLRTFRVRDAESENCARGFFFAFPETFASIRTGRKSSVWRQTRPRLPRLESHARSSRVE